MFRWLNRMTDNPLENRQWRIIYASRCGLGEIECSPMYATFWLNRVLDFDHLAVCSPCLKSALWNTAVRRYLIIDWNVKVRLHSRITCTWNRLKLIFKRRIESYISILLEIGIFEIRKNGKSHKISVKRCKFHGHSGVWQPSLVKRSFLNDLEYYWFGQIIVLRQLLIFFDLSPNSITDNVVQLHLFSLNLVIQFYTL